MYVFLSVRPPVIDYRVAIWLVIFDYFVELYILLIFKKMVKMAPHILFLIQSQMENLLDCKSIL